MGSKHITPTTNRKRALLSLGFGRPFALVHKKNEHQINDGTDISKCAQLLSAHPNVFAIGVNCTAPKYISGLIKVLKENSGTKKILVYPNSGEAYNSKTKTWLGLSEPVSFAEMTKEWIGLGADIVGGCCRIGPDHIKNIHKILTKPNN